MRIILAGRSTLFHKTTVGPASAILRSGRFELKPSDGTEEEERISGGSYYLSTARTPDNRFARNSVWSYSVVFVLDGTKLAARYKIRPVDYWQMGPEAKEHEERVFSRGPFIPSLPYIKEIHAGVNDKIADLQRLALKRKIPLFFYNESKDLLTLNKRKSVKLPLQKRPEPGQKLGTRRGISYIKPWLILWSYPANQLGSYAERKAVIDKMPRKVNYTYGLLGYPNDAIRALKADLHNAKGMQYGDAVKHREDLDALIKLLRTNRLTVEQFVKRLELKWFPRGGK